MPHTKRAVQIPREEIDQIECRFAVFIPPGKDEFGRSAKDDFHLVKEMVHTKDGRKVPNVRIIKNYKRKFWVTRPGWRKHTDKKEWEELGRVQEFSTTHSQLYESAARALDTPWVTGGMRKLARSPYLYGTDIESTCLIKQSYIDRFTGEPTKFGVSCFDIETNVLDKDGKIIMATLSYESRVYTAVTESFVKGIDNPIPKLKALMQKYLGDVVAARSIDWEVEVVRDDVAVVCGCFKRAHEWKPDFLAIWNIDFDLPKVVETLESRGVKPQDVFSDPAVPYNNRFFEYIRGPSQKKTADGKLTSILFHARWHTALCPSSFYFIDAMCAYRHLRTGQGEEPSYSLDAIMNKHLKRGKLSFTECDHLAKVDWHKEMQSKYPLEYVIYNVFDTIGMELLDEETTDLAVSLPQQAGPSDWRNFNKQPRRVCDELHFYVQRQGHVMGSTSDAMDDDFDKIVIGLSGWITMLPAHLVADNGLSIVDEFPDVTTNLRIHIGD